MPTAKNAEILALEKALTIAGFLETIECLIRDLDAFVKVIPREYKLELGSYVQTLKTMYSCLDEDSELEELLSKTQTFKEKFPTHIQRLGKVKEVIALSEQGMTQREIADKIGVSPDTVSRFLRYYKNSTAIDKAKIKQTDVFDIYNNLQELYSAVLLQYSKSINDMESNPKYMDMWLKVIKESDRILDKWSIKQQIEEMIYKNREVIQKYVPPELQEACANELISLYKSKPVAEPTRALKTVNV